MEFLSTMALFLINALKNSGFSEDFRYLNENITNEITKENNNYNKKKIKIEKGKLYGLTPLFVN